MDQKKFDTSEEPLFLKVRSIDTVVVGENEICKVLSFMEVLEIHALPHYSKWLMLIQEKLSTFMLLK